MKRLTPAALSLIMFLVVGGLVSAYVVKGLFAVEKKTTPPVERRNIAMALSDIKPGTILTDKHIGQGPILVSELRSDMLLNERVLIGRVVKEQLKAARPITSSQLYEPGVGPALAVEPGMRAVTLDFAANSAIVEGFIKPNDYCDVHMTVNDVVGDERYAGGFSLTLFKGVRVLAINRLTTAGPVERNGNAVTLELTTGQANVALLARDKGTLTLTYTTQGKGEGGIAVSDSDRVMLSEILRLQPKKAILPPFTVQVYRGRDRKQLQFLENNGIDESITGAQTPRDNAGGNVPSSPPSTQNSAPRSGGAPAPAAPSASGSGGQPVPPSASLPAPSGNDIFGTLTFDPNSPGTVN